MATDAATPPVGWFELADARLYYAPVWLPGHQQLLAQLTTGLDWRQDRIRLFGRERDVPRLTAWFSDPGVRYRYSGLTLLPAPWPPALDALRRRLARELRMVFNSVLVNHYRSGADSMGLHSDDEPELGPAPVVATVSLGASRRLVMRHKTRAEVWRGELTGGSLLVMAGQSQHCWRHELPKTRRTVAPRISLTFRRIVPALASSC